MNSLIETLNHSGETFLDFAWPIAWQSGLLIAALLAFDFLFRRQVRASVRYAVWLVVLVKLIVPPTLALPTSPAWWLLRQPPVIQIQPQMQNYTVSYDDDSLSPASLNSLPAYVPPKPAMTCAAWLLVLSAATSTGLLAWLLIRWWQITRRVSCAKTSERLTAIAAQARLLAGVRARPPVKLTADTMSPAVCGLFRPAILIPQTLAENFSDEQLRAVLLHELIHLRRRDVWLNFLQSLLQIVYWWHPLVWLANARIRRVREEAVDDAVMLALAGGAEAYAPTLLQVAKLALNRPLVSLGLVGIMESRSALRQRIERLVDFRPPRRAGLTLVSIFGILAFTAVAVPMGGAPGATEEQILPAPAVPVPAMVTNTSPSRYQQRLETIIKKKQPSADDMVKSASLMADAQSDLQFSGPQEFPPSSGMDTSILNNPNFSAALHELQKREEVEELPEPEVVTRSGREVNRLDEVSIPLASEGSAESSSQTHPAARLFLRGFKVDTQPFIASLGLKPLPGDFGEDSPPAFYPALRKFVTDLGVNLESPSGKTISFNEKRGLLYVKATESDLDKIGGVLQALPPQVHIKARFLEVPKGTFAGLAKMVNISNQSNQLVGILTLENFQTALRNLQARPDVEELAEPEVLMLNGRQAQVRVTQIITVITNFSLQEMGTNTAIIPQTEQTETGPILDTVPHVLSDGHTINLLVTASRAEFWGYADVPANTPQQYTTNSIGQRIPLAAIWPAIQMNQESANVNLFDNQTLVLTPAPEVVQIGAPDKQREEVVARHVHEGEKIQGKDGKILLVFVTVILVDPVGNRVYSEDEMPFAKTGIPPQPPQ